MVYQKKNNQFLRLITDTGRKVIKQIGWLFFISLSFYTFDNYYLKNKCELTKTSSVCFLSPFMGDLGENIFQVAIIIWFFDIGLKRETLEEIHQIFQFSQATKHIKGFYLKREDYNRLIEDSFRTVGSEQKIKILCLSEEINLFQQENLRDIREKVVSGCELKILILHPKSSLLECLEAVGFTSNLYPALLKAFSMKLKRLVNDLDAYRTRHKIRGSIEVKLHKNLFSPIGYYSDSKDFRIVWMYFSDFHNGNEYPAFHISNQNLIDDTEKHFENLWDRTRGEEMLLMRLSQDDTINNIDRILP